MNEITDYSGLIRDGIYYVETTSFFPLSGNGWYFRGRLEYAMSLGIEMTIKYELIPSYTLPVTKPVKTHQTLPCTTLKIQNNLQRLI